MVAEGGGEGRVKTGEGGGRSRGRAGREEAGGLGRFGGAGEEGRGRGAGGKVGFKGVLTSGLPFGIFRMVKWMKRGEGVRVKVRRANETFAICTSLP